MKKTVPPVIAVPSGNFGNICAGLMAHHSGLPVKHFIAACNANDVVPEYFSTGKYKPQKAVATISNAMDVGDPSNFVRILEIFGHDIEALKKMVSSVSVSDEVTKATISKTFKEEKYLLDPHGAVAYSALQARLGENEKGIFLETAHPVKFYDVVEPVIGKQVPIPKVVQAQLSKEKKATTMEVDSELLKHFLLQL